MILRIYADAEGETHFEEVEFAFNQTDPRPPGAARPHGDWHPVPQRLLAVYLSGTGTIEASDGELRHLLPGTILLAEDTIGKGHISRVTGAEDMLVLILMLPDLPSSDSRANPLQGTGAGKTSL
jgi:hypothetical protein